MMNFKKRNSPSKMTKAQKIVYSSLKESRMHFEFNHWSDFKDIREKIEIEKKKLKHEILLCKSNLSKMRELELKVIELDELKQKLVFSRLEEFKLKIYENSKNQSPNNRLTCYYCEEIMDDKLNKNNNCNTIEHILSKSSFKEYTFAPFNLVPICNACNIKKGNVSVLVNPDDKRPLNKKEYMIVHPYLDNKDDFLKLNELNCWQIADIKNSLFLEKAKNTIFIYDLLRTRLTLNLQIKKDFEMKRQDYNLLLDNNKVSNDTKDLIKSRDQWIEKNTYYNKPCVNR